MTGATFKWSGLQRAMWILITVLKGKYLLLEDKNERERKTSRGEMEFCAN